MYLLENFNSIYNPESLCFENIQPQPNQSQEISPEEQQSPSVEFEDIKKFLLFNRLKEIKLKLELSNINKSDEDILNLFNFIDTILLFYNTFTYDQCMRIVNSLIENISHILHISIPNYPNSEDPNQQIPPQNSNQQIPPQNSNQQIPPQNPNQQIPPQNSNINQ